MVWENEKIMVKGLEQLWEKGLRIILEKEMLRIKGLEKFGIIAN